MSARLKFARCAIIRFVSTLYQSDNGFRFTYTSNVLAEKAARDSDIGQILNNVYAYARCEWRKSNLTAYHMQQHTLSIT